tara:strand:- start:1777 stop:1974 length:198 start_codon:yes stop_codon:yes gene_type:complete
MADVRASRNEKNSSETDRENSLDEDPNNFAKLHEKTQNGKGSSIFDSIKTLFGKEQEAPSFGQGK